MSYEPVTLEKAARAQELRALALTYEEIGIILGVEYNTKPLTRSRVHQLLRHVGGCISAPHVNLRKFYPCKVCGKDLGPRGSSIAKYHVECRPQKKMLDLICDTCGKEFRRGAREEGSNLMRHKASKAVFCNRQCAAKRFIGVPWVSSGEQRL